MAERGSKGGNPIVMIAAFVVMAGFLYWLNLRATPAEVAVVEGSDSMDVAVSIDAGTFAADPMAHAGQRIRIGPFPVEATVGTDGFFLAIPNMGGPYLVRMDSALVAEGRVVNNEDLVTVTGQVYVMNDSVADAWVADGGITEADKVIVTFAESYILADDVVVSTPIAPAGGGN
ncbi:MAG: hypothetical protein D6701_12885 [Gemmatimonadetes bacterium]|nr:MAG: hypothetical protein D6701_12885 [Gemmatimonadota bacterium]